jgi:hypothetical protein
MIEYLSCVSVNTKTARILYDNTIISAVIILSDNSRIICSIDDYVSRCESVGIVVDYTIVPGLKIINIEYTDNGVLVLHSHTNKNYIQFIRCHNDDECIDKEQYFHIEVDNTALWKSICKTF